MIRRLIPWLRRVVQGIAAAALIGLPVIALYEHYRQARALEDLPPGDWRTAVIRQVDRWAGENKTRRQFLESTQGTIWSARVGGVSVTDPLAGAETVAASRTLYRPLLWSLWIPIVVSLFFGRVFCGWVCPMNTLLEFVDRGRRVLGWAELRQRDVRFSLRNKYLVLALALVVVACTGSPFLALIYPPAVLSREAHLWVFRSGLGAGALLIAGIVAMELFVSRRWWCRYMCPGGALYSLLGRFRVIRVKRDAAKCVQCGDCVRVCQFDLRPMLVQITGMECTNCGTCIRACESDALHFRVVAPRLPTRSQSSLAKKDPAAKRPDDMKAVERHPATASRGTGGTSMWMLPLTAMVLTLTLAESPRRALAHHILGLPHYSYKENYPQVPTLEYPAQTGPYDVLMTSYPGQPVPGEAALLAFYIKDRNTGTVYDSPISVRVLKTSTFGSNETIYGPESRTAIDNQFKFTVTFPEDGEYVVELTMDVEGQTEVIGFLMVAGEPTAMMSILIAVGAGLIVFVVVIRAIKVKLRRAQSRGPGSRAVVGKEPSCEAY